MAALTQARMAREKRMKNIALPLAAGAKAFAGGIACGDTSDGTVKQGQTSTTLVKIGEFAETFDNTSGASAVNVLVSLDREVVARWYDNAGDVVAADLFQDAYIVDDHTVALSSATNTRSKAGRIWAVDSAKGVLIESYTL